MFCIVGKSPSARFTRGAFRDGPSQSPAATAPPKGGALGRTGKFRPHRSTAGRSLPLSSKLFAFAKASTFGGGGISQSEMTEGVSSGTNPLSRLRRQLSRRASLWQNRQVSSSFVNDRTSWPVTQKLYAFAKASTFGGGGISQSEMTEGVSSGTNPLSRLRRQLFPFLSPDGDIFPRPGEVFRRESSWQNQQVSSTPVNGRRSQPITPKTLRPCQSLHLRGRWHGEAVTERVSQSELSAGSAERPAYSVIFRRCKKQERRTSCFYEYCTGAGSLFLSIA